MLIYIIPEMSSNPWDLPLASADSSLLTTDECYLLLDADFSDDLLKSFTGAAPKPEPNISEYHLHEDGTLYPQSPPSPLETKPNRAQLASDLLSQLDHQCKQENIFSNWLEEKVDLPMFEGVTDITPSVYPAPLLAPRPTEELLREFETVYDAVELTHLTPPQSPPGPATQLLLSYAHQAHVAAPAPPAHPVWHDHELPTVEELLSGDSAVTSPCSSPRSSSADEDWTSGSGSSRPKPYSRAPEDRRSRKKEQNKNAATRYRQKKKAEIDLLLGEENELRQRHTELGGQRADLQREIRYLKGLMRELFKAKGLIK